MDDYETHDDRRLLTGTGFTIEPGIYTPTFGVRTEINMVVGAASAEVTGPQPADAGEDSHGHGAETPGAQTTIKTRVRLENDTELTQCPRENPPFFYGSSDRLCVSSSAGMILASRLDLAPAVVRRAVNVPATNSAPLVRADRRDDVPHDRARREPGRREHQGDQPRARSAQGLDDLFGCSCPSRSANRGGQAAAAGAARGASRRAPAAASSSTRPATS